MDDFVNGYGNSRCAVVEHESTTPEASMQGYCPRCALHNLVVVNDKLVPMFGMIKEMVPLTRLIPKGKNDPGKKSKVEQADTDHKAGKTGSKHDLGSTNEQDENEMEPVDVGGMSWS
ncbi:hypothetical protein FKW77_004520 [Venturia effusa]|uniref:Uncharacterized protein n=1 Tax=Venturia effusa TaxID=50376 RepID=A0A517LIL2_9PEZI|nr:hypothetical protein FKW77_004520 [Venturia effusa]